MRKQLADAATPRCKRMSAPCGSADSVLKLHSVIDDTKPSAAAAATRSTAQQSIQRTASATAASSVRLHAVPLAGAGSTTGALELKMQPGSSDSSSCASCAGETRALSHRTSASLGFASMRCSLAPKGPKPVTMTRGILLRFKAKDGTCAVLNASCRLAERVVLGASAAIEAGVRGCMGCCRHVKKRKPK